MFHARKDAKKGTVYHGCGPKTLVGVGIGRENRRGGPEAVVKRNGLFPGGAK